MKSPLENICDNVYVHVYMYIYIYTNQYEAVLYTEYTRLCVYILQHVMCIYIYTYRQHIYIYIYTYTHGCGTKIGTQNGTLVNGNEH